MGSQEEKKTSHNHNNKLLLDALTAHMERKMNNMIDVWLKEFKPSVLDRGKRNQIREKHQEVVRDETTPNYYNQSSHGSQERRRRGREERVVPRSNLGGHKIRIPPFHGTNDLNAYLEWEKKIELVFECQEYTEKNRVKIASTEFYGYALCWWDHLVTTRRLVGDVPIETWLHMKTLMRKRFVPSYYHHKLHPKPRDVSRRLEEPLRDKDFKASNHNESNRSQRERERGREGKFLSRENKSILTPIGPMEPCDNRDRKLIDVIL